MASIQPTQTINYRSVGDLDIHLDVYLPPNAQNVPVLLWFHGGGLLQGHRSQLAPHMRHAVHKHSLCVLSADYRLAPQTRIPEIFSDVQDCVSFIRSSLPSHLPGNAVDPSRLAVSGSSAGGYLALLAGLYCEPKPTCLVPIYPITDPLGSFFTTSQPEPMGRYLASHNELASCLDPNAKAVANCGPLGEDVRMHMYVRMLADASLANLLGIKRMDAADALKWRISRNVYSRGLPPMYVLHGDGDEAVGVEQADEVVGAAVGCAGDAEGRVVYERPHRENHFLDVGAGYENERLYGWLMGQLKGNA